MMVRGVALASVVPALTMAWCAAAYRMIGKDALVCSAETAGSLFEADYPNPHEIGADRVADAVAAKALYGAPVIVVDFGTATNMEVVDADGASSGGVIAPGVETVGLRAVLARHEAGGHRPGRPSYRHRAQHGRGHQAGIVYGEADRVDGIIPPHLRPAGLRDACGGDGGLASRVAAQSQTITAINPELTLEGLRLVYEAQEGAASV